MTLETLLAGALSAFIVAGVVHRFVKARRKPRTSRPSGATAPVLPAAPARAGTAKVEDLPDEDQWSRAIDAAASGAFDEARSHFAAAIRKDPRKCCGVGHGSLKPARPEAQRVWLQAMSEAGFGKLADTLRNPPDPAGLTISAMMAADRRAEEILDATCHRLGIGQGAAAHTVAASLPVEDGPAGWVEERLGDRNAWQFALEKKHRDYLAALDGDDLRLVVGRVGEKLGGTDDYWVLCNCEKLLEPLGERAAAVLPQLVHPRHLQHANAPWRRVALSALGHLGPAATAALPAILAAQDDPDYHVREAAVAARKRVHAEPPPPGDYGEGCSS